MRDAVVVEAVRTPVGRRRGALAGVHPVDLSAVVLRALVDRAGIDPALVDDVIWGCVSQVGEQALEHRPQRGAGGGLAGVGARHHPGPAVRVVPAGPALRRRGGDRRPGRRGGGRRGGVDDPGADGRELRPAGRRLPFGAGLWSRRYARAGVQPGRRRRDDRRQWGLSPRAASTGSRWPVPRAGRRRAATSGAFDRRDRPGAGRRRRRRRRRRTRASAGTARMARGSPGRAGGPRFGRPTVAVTAGNASQISDGAAALLVTTSEWRRRHGCAPLARVHAVVVAGGDPVHDADRPDPGHREGAAPRPGWASRRSACSR